MGLWSIIALYVSGLIGAGFASGQELVIFFVNYGRLGFFGVAWALCLLTLGSVLVLEVGARYGSSSYRDLFNQLDQGFVAILDGLYSVFLFVGASVMIAGLGTLGDDPSLGLVLQLASVALIFFVLQRGVEEVGRASGYLAPLLVIILCSIALKRLLHYPLTFPTRGSWAALEAGTLYASYNLGFAMALLASVSTYLTNQKQRWAVALGANLIIGICLVLLLLALSTLPKALLLSDLPLQNLVKLRGSPLAFALYQFMLWGAMVSTTLANLLALVSRMTGLTKISWQKASLIATSCAFVLSYVGFGTLVRVAYPILGLAGLWLLAGLVRTLFRK